MAANTKKIGGVTYQMNPLPGWAGLEAFHRTIAVLGPALQGVVVQALRGEAKGNPKALVGTLIAAVPEAAMRTKPAELRELVEQLLAQTNLVGGKGTGPVLNVVDTMFQGKLFNLFELIAWAVEVNFSDFFEQAARRLPASKAKETSGSTSPKGSNTSGQPQDSSPTDGSPSES